MTTTFSASILLENVRRVEDLQDRLAEVHLSVSQLYGSNAGLLVKEVLEQRKIARDAAEYAAALIGSADLPDEADDAATS